MRYALLLLLLVGCGGGGTSAPSNGIVGTYEVRFANGQNPLDLRYGFGYDIEMWRTDGVAAKFGSGRFTGTGSGTEFAFSGSDDGEMTLRIVAPGNNSGKIFGRLKQSNGQYVTVAETNWASQSGPLFRCDVTLTHAGNPWPDEDVVFTLGQEITVAAKTGTAGEASKDLPLNATRFAVARRQFSKLRVNGTVFDFPIDGSNLYIPIPAQPEGALVTFDLEYMN